MKQSEVIIKTTSMKRIIKKQERDDEVLQVELKEPVPDDKFDRHMELARKNDRRSRRKVFLNQSRADSDRDDRNADIKPSVY